MYSVDGKLVKTIKENNTNLSELSKSMYILNVKFENGKAVTKKIIKN
ncbi:hypothetical protein J3D55_001485 [Chryseobacterium ginsenosidimutans]|nr:hypothetical protein [Chryseobacterium ginsenosidimutans]